MNGEVSPDGHWLVYEDSQSSRAEIYLRSFPNVRQFVRQVSTNGGARPVWGRNGRELFYYVGPDTIMAVPTILTIAAPDEAPLGPEPLRTSVVGWRDEQTLGGGGVTQAWIEGDDRGSFSIKCRRHVQRVKSSEGNR